MAAEENDGRLDPVKVAAALRGAGTEPKQLFVNSVDPFEGAAGAIGLDDPLARARRVLWIDLDRDGRRDFFEGKEARLDDRTPNSLMNQGRSSAGARLGRNEIGLT